MNENETLCLSFSQNGAHCAQIKCTANDIANNHAIKSRRRRRGLTEDKEGRR